MKYSEKLKDPRWQKKRLEVFSRDGFKCRCCDDSKSMLSVHHIHYCEDPWDSNLIDLVTLCNECHSEWHRIYDNHYTDVIKSIVDLYHIIEIESISIELNKK